MNRQRIHLAACDGDLTALQEELDKGVDVDIEDPTDFNSTALSHAAYNRLDAVKLLIEKKATVDKLDSLRRTALILACIEGHISIAAILLDSGAEINKMSKT